MEPKQKILIVDDSEINRAMLKEILGEGYEYLEAENGLRAIEILRRRTDIALVYGTEHAHDTETVTEG